MSCYGHTRRCTNFASNKDTNRSSTSSTMKRQKRSRSSLPPNTPSYSIPPRHASGKPSQEGHPNMEVMQKVFPGISLEGLPNCTLVSHVCPSRSERQHYQKMQTKSTPISLSSHGGRVPFRCHPHRASRLPCPRP